MQEIAAIAFAVRHDVVFACAVSNCGSQPFFYGSWLTILPSKLSVFPESHNRTSLILHAHLLIMSTMVFPQNLITHGELGGHTFMADSDETRATCLCFIEQHYGDALARLDRDVPPCRLDMLGVLACLVSAAFAAVGPVWPLRVVVGWPSDMIRITRSDARLFTTNFCCPVRY